MKIEQAEQIVKQVKFIRGKLNRIDNELSTIKRSTSIVLDYGKYHRLSSSLFSEEQKSDILKLLKDHLTKILETERKSLEEELNRIDNE